MDDNKPRLETVNISDLTVRKGNPNIMTGEKLKSLEHSINKFDRVQHIVINQDNIIVDGAQRFAVFKKMGFDRIDVIRVITKNENDLKLLSQALNKIHGEHDIKRDIDEMSLLLDYDPDELDKLLSFGDVELDKLRQQMIEEEQEEQEQLQKLDTTTEKEDGGETDEDLESLPSVEEIKEPVTQFGDIWQLGKHLVMCGDCTIPEDVDKLMPHRNRINLVVTSPPYDNFRSYDNNFRYEIESIVKILRDNVLVDNGGGVVVWVSGDQTMEGDESGTSFRNALLFKKFGFKLHDTMIYKKAFLRMPENIRYYQNFEYMFVFVKGKLETFNPIKDHKNKEPGTKATRQKRDYDGTLIKQNVTVIPEYRMRNNVWEYGDSESYNKILLGHPARFPLKLASDHIISWSNKNDLILDPFLGSGTTLIACEQNNRICHGIDINPKYIDITIERWEKRTGNSAVRLSDGKKYGELKEKKEKKEKNVREML